MSEIGTLTPFRFVRQQIPDYRVIPFCGSIGDNAGIRFIASVSPVNDGGTQQRSPLEAADGTCDLAQQGNGERNHGRVRGYLITR
jgi:hypothetical protein